MNLDTFPEQRRLLLQELLSGRAAAHRARSDAVQPREPGQPVPVSVEQKQVWFHGSMAPDVPLAGAQPGERWVVRHRLPDGSATD